MSETSTQRDGAQVRQVTSVETLKALADPLRLAIMKALMRDSQDWARPSRSRVRAR